MVVAAQCCSRWKIAVAGVAMVMAAAGCHDDREPHSTATLSATLSPPGSSEHSSPTAEPGSCATAVARDDKGWLLLALGDPSCVTVAPEASASQITVAVESDGEPLFSSSGDRASTVVLPDTAGPYGPSGCPPGKNFELTAQAATAGTVSSEARVLLACGPHPPTEACGEPTGLRGPGDIGVSGTEDNVCLFWLDPSDDETSFRVEVTYPRGGLVFAYLVPGNTTVFRLPAEAAPRLSESPARCLTRKDVDVRVYAVAPGFERLAGISATVAECRS